MTVALIKPQEKTTTEQTLHECATCRHKDRAYIKSPDGRRFAAIWRCRVLSEKTQQIVLVQPHENCYEHRSLTDHWEESDVALVR